MSTSLSNVLAHVNTTSESFVSAYYTAWDKDRNTLKSLYTPNSRIVWNGNPISGSGEMEQFIEKMPASRHDIQAFDCHPLPGSTEANMSSIIISVSGTLQTYNASEGEPLPPPPRPAPGQPRQPRQKDDTDIDLLPRLFSHSFVLCPDRGADGTLSYVVQSETFRFVG